MIKVPKEMIIEKIKEKANLTDAQIQSKVKDKLDQLSGLISEEGALHIIANELGVKILEDAGNLQVKNVLAGMRNVEITGKVVKVYEIREFDKNNRKGRVGNFLIGDETGVMRVVAWNDKASLLEKIKEGTVVKIKNGYSRDNQGRVEIHLGDKTQVSIETDTNIEVKPQTRERKSIVDLNENENNVEVMGTIVQVFDPRFFPVDPETGKKLTERDGEFYLNEQLVSTPTYSYVVNLFLDDGSENIRVVLWRNQTQKLFNMTHEEIVAKKDDSFEEIKNDLLGQIVKFVGRTNKNQMFERVEFIPQLVFMNPNPDEEIERLNKEIEAAPKKQGESVGKKSDVVEEKVSTPEPVQEKVNGTPVEKSQPVQEIKVEEKVIVKEPTTEEIINTPTESVEEPDLETPSETVEKIDLESSEQIDGGAKESVKPVDEVTEVDDLIEDAESEIERETSNLEEIDDVDEITDLDSI